jgi:hypothetical protein
MPDATKISQQKQNSSESGSKKVKIVTEEIPSGFFLRILFSGNKNSFTGNFVVGDSVGSGVFGGNLKSQELEGRKQFLQGLIKSPYNS